MQDCEVLKGKPLRKRKNRIESIRLGVQVISLVTVLWIGFRFYLWAHAMEQGRLEGFRPPGVEGFLPISALISLRHLFLTGEASRVHPAGLVLLVLILANGLLLKRSFCSWICPVGTISESLSSIGHKLTRRRLRLPTAIDYPLRGLKYLLLAFFLYAVFVKMSPPEITRFLNSPYNKVADIKMLEFFVHPSSFTVNVLLGLVVLSTVIPYFWCRYLCPYGAFLAGLSLLSPVKIRRDPQSCIDCGLCTKACPAHLKVDKLTRVDSDECFGCNSCVAACPVPIALSMGLPGRRRRTFSPTVYALLVAGLFFGGIGLAKLAGYWRNQITSEEYLRRTSEINGPQYTHIRGRVPEYGPQD
jgi:polyferredoxin